MSQDLIYVLNKRVQLLQTAKGFRTSIDSVLLAAACRAEMGEKILDLGCGVGSAGLCVLFRVSDIALSGVEIQAESVELARQNAALNGMTERCVFEQTDIRDFKGRNFHHVICNPPFLEAGTHMVSPSESLAIAKGQKDSALSLKHWIDAGYKALKSQGSLTIIHRADHTDKIVQVMGARFGAVEIIPLWPHAGESAKRVIVRALKDRKSGGILHPGLVLHRDDGSYTDAADRILRDAQAL
jgi:tRNA1(Val) A37 N6-methylase TrmN6